MAAAGRMEIIRARLRELPPRERFWALVSLLTLAGMAGWWAAEWFGVFAAVAVAARVLLGKPGRTADQPPRDADAERLEQDLQHQRDRAFELFHPGETRPAPPPEEEDHRDPGDAYYLEKDMEHRRREAARVLRAGADTPPQPPAPDRAPAALFPPDPRPLPPAPRGRELFKDAPPPARPIVEEGSRLFRRSRRSSGKIVE